MSHRLFVHGVETFFFIDIFDIFCFPDVVIEADVRIPSNQKKKKFWLNCLGGFGNFETHRTPMNWF